jgi:hypothetical protein
MSTPTDSDPAPPTVTLPSRPSPRLPLLARLENWAFPVRTPVPANRTGTPEPDKHESVAYLLALAIGLLGAFLLEQSMAVLPLPPGGDPAEWITTSYAYVGLPYPTWIVPGQYPPLLFPFLGLLVRLFGPIQAGRAFIAVAAVLLSLSTYYLARSLVASRSVALGVAGFVVLSPTLVQVFYFGGYPNLLGLVFLNFAVAFLLRFVRSGSGWHALGFWVAFAAAILTHTLVGTVLAGTFVLMFAFLLWQRRIPRTLYRDAAALAGVGFFVAAVGGFYLLTRLIGVAHPQYLQTSAFAFVKNGIGSLYFVVLSPYLPRIHPSVPLAEFASLILTAAIVLVLCALRLLAPQRLTLGVLTVLAMIGTVIGGAIVGWELSIVTDYLRFGYFLIVPIGLGFGLIVENLLHYSPEWPVWLRRSRSRRRPSVGGSGPSVGSLPAIRHRRAYGSWSKVGVAAFAVGVALLVLSTAFVTYPSLPAYEQQNAASFHDATFLAALHDIQKSGIPGNVFTIGGAAKWTRAILDRNAYTPFIATRYTFDPTHLDFEETTYFAMVARDTVTNNLVAATIAGTNVSSNNQTPDYEASFFGVFTPVATLVASNFTVTVTNGTSTLVESVTSAPSVVASVAGTPGMTLFYNETGFTFSIAIAISATSPVARYTLTALAAPGWSVLDVRGNLTGPAASVQVTNFKAGTIPGELVLNPTGLPGSLLTFANVTPVTAVSRPQAFNHPNQVAHAGLEVAASGGAPSLNLSVVFTTPTARNLINDLPPFIDTPTVWQNWSIRFVLLTNQSQFVTNHPSAILWDVAYLQSEFGASILAVEGDWTVVLLPAHYR